MQDVLPCAACFTLHKGSLCSSITSTGCGTWELQSAADYEAGKPAGTDPEHDALREATADSLAAWTAAQLGYPVDLELTYATIATVGIAPRNAHVGKEPAYYVRPAAAGGNPACG